MGSAYAWLFWATLSTACFAGLRWIGRWDEHLGAFLILYAGAWLAAWGVSRTRVGIVALVLMACAFRALLVPLEPTLSDDLYRYVWEGRIQALGHNPYLLPPTASELEALRDSLWHSINNPGASAIYPPLAQIAFRLMAASGEITLFKAVFSGLDLALVILLGWTLRRRGQPVERLALYAWNPLVVVEVSGSGHLEPLAILPLVVAIVCARRSGLLAWVAFAASFSLKYAAGLLAPFLVQAARPRLRDLLVVVALLGLVTLPYADAGANLLKSLLLYTDKWRYNDMLFNLVQSILGSLWWSKACVAMVLLVVVGVLVRARVALEAKAMTALLALVLLSPTIHPWYLLWAVALLPLVHSSALFTWSGTIVLAYLFLYPAFGWGPVDKGSALLRLVQILPVALAAGLDAWRMRRTVKTVPEQAAPVEGGL